MEKGKTIIDNTAMLSLSQLVEQTKEEIIELELYESKIDEELNEARDMVVWSKTLYNDFDKKLDGFMIEQQSQLSLSDIQLEAENLCRSQEELAKLIDQTKNEIMDLRINESKIDGELEEARHMVVWSKTIYNDFDKKLEGFMIEEEPLLSLSDIQLEAESCRSQEELAELANALTGYEERMKKWTKLLKRHMSDIDDIKEHGCCPCTTFKECVIHAKKIKKYKSLISTLEKVGRICLTLGVVQMWDKGNRKEKSTYFIPFMILLFFGKYNEKIKAVVDNTEMSFVSRLRDQYG